MPGLPPITEVIRHMRNAPYRPTMGGMPATKEKATASGTRAKATVSPENISALTLPLEGGTIEWFEFTKNPFKTGCNYQKTKK